MTEEQQAVQSVMETAGCDKWIARHALASSNGCVHAAAALVRERASYRSSLCRCGEVLAGKWNYCPYCGTRKEG